MYRCGICGDGLEKRLIHIRNTTVSRLYCNICKKDFTQEQACDVCRQAFENRAMVTTSYKSQILGSYTTRHCSLCQPPAKIVLEFQRLPIAAFCKYALIYGLPALCLLLILFALFSGAANH